MSNVTRIAGRSSAAVLRLATPLPAPAPVVPFPLRGKPVPAPDPDQPPPIPNACPADILREAGVLFLLAPTEAGQDKAEELDGDLLACCAEAHGLDIQARTLADRIAAVPKDSDVALAAFTIEDYRDAIAHAARLPARTPEGLQAKAHLLLLDLRSGQHTIALSRSLATDVAGRSL